MGGYHEAFWLATAAVAPLVTLAAVVALPDAAIAVDWRSLALRELGGVAGDRGDPPQEFSEAIARADYERHRQEYWKSRAVAAYRATLINMVVQAGLLAVSLAALATGRDLIPTWIPIVLAVGGILVLARTLIYGAEIRRAMDRVEPLAPGDRNPEQ